MPHLWTDGNIPETEESKRHKQVLLRKIPDKRRKKDTRTYAEFEEDCLHGLHQTEYMHTD